MKKYKYNDNERKILEFHDFMCDDSSEVRIPPAIMEGYTPIRQPLTAQTRLRLKAVSFGLIFGMLYAIAGYFHLSK